MAVHNFKLSPGHSRFIYKQDLDGLYRLQTERVENLKQKQRPTVQATEEDSNVNVTYELDGDIGSVDSPVNIKFKKIVQSKTPVGTPAHLQTEESNENSSKDINDLAIVKKLQKNPEEKEL